MNDKLLTEQLHQAIDQGDLEAIDRCLDALSALGAKPIVAEDPTDFAARILLMDKENRPMKLSKHYARVLAAAAAISVLAVTVYAAASMHFFSFQSGDRFVTMTTNQAMTDQEARALVEQDANQSAAEPAEPQNATEEIPTQTFDTIEQAEAAFDMDLILPEKMPQMTQDDITGQQYFYGEGASNSTVWLSYSDDNGRNMEVTTTREVIPAGEALTSYTSHEFDEGSLDKYQSKSGITYTTLTESDSTGEMTAHIATTMIGEYEYALVFFGFDEAERQAIIDSCDLTPYQK